MKPISWSELQAYENDYIDWYVSYILGIKKVAIPQQNRGKDIHELLQSRGTKTPREGQYTVGEERIHREILVGFNSFVDKIGIQDFESEVEVITEIAGCPTKGYFDLLSRATGTLVEIKTGRDLWTQGRADEHGQLHFYDCAADSCKIHLERIILFSASTGNGKTKFFEVKRSEEKRQNIKDRIAKAFNSFGKYAELRQ